MDAFETGSHVLIELDNERRLAGYLVSEGDTGFVVKVTHKDMPMTHSVSELLSAALRDDLDQVPAVFLAAELVSKKMFGSLGRKARMVEALALLQEAELIAQHQEARPVTFHELSVPVLTFINGGNIAIMEDSNDVMDDMEVDMKVEAFVKSVDSGIEEILKVADKPAE